MNVPGGSTKLEVFQSGGDGDVAFWTGFQKAEVKMNGNDKLVPMNGGSPNFSDFAMAAGSWFTAMPIQQPRRKKAE